MRYPLISLGLISLLTAETVAAQCMTSESQSLANKEPIGEYAKQVIERADEGLSRARSTPGGSTLVDRLLNSWVATFTSAVLQLVDTDLRIVKEERDLIKNTPCLHVDLLILEAKMDEVRCEMDSAIDRGSTNAILRLQSLLAFLNTRYSYLVEGGRDPLYQDKSWHLYHVFDEPFDVWCCPNTNYVCEFTDADRCQTELIGDVYYSKADCLSFSYCAQNADEVEDATGREDEETSTEYDQICPFDSHYLAPNSSGFGCQLELLEDYDDIPGIEKELEGLREVLEKKDEFLEEIDFLEEITRTMDDVTDQRFLTDEERQHLQQFGETRQEEIEQRHVWDCRALKGDGEDNERAPDDDKPWSEWSAIAKRGPFSLAIDQISLWRQFFQLRANWEQGVKFGTGTIIGREFPDFLKHPYEFPTEEERKEALERDQQSLSTAGALRSYLRDTLWIPFQLWQSRREASILPKASDFQLQVIDSMSPVRPAILNTSELIIGDPNSSSSSTDFKGMRKFVRDYAFFVRRSCIFRPCNNSLDRVLRIIFEPKCFPYTSGDYLESDWTECQSAAGG